MLFSLAVADRKVCVSLAVPDGEVFVSLAVPDRKLCQSSGPGQESVSQSLHDIRLVRNTFLPAPSLCAW